MKNIYKTWLEIDSKALLQNLNFFKKVVGPRTTLMAVIKANAYGHGLLEVAQIFKKNQNLWFGVDSIEEALTLKNSGARNPIMILGFIPFNRFGEAVRNKFHISIYNPETIKSSLKFPKGLFHIKIETGTNRLGLTLKELIKFGRLPKIIGVYTHFADIENKNSLFYKKQLGDFKKTLLFLKSKNIFPKFIHTASTSAILRDKKTHFNLVRLGLGLYKNILGWKAMVTQIKFISKGETIGYDRTFKARKNMKIAILPVGYYDGYDRRFSNNGEILINGKIAKVVGRICMNMFMADVTHLKNVKVGDEAVILGGIIKAQNIAQKAGTILYEILARLGSHLPRVIV